MTHFPIDDKNKSQQFDTRTIVAQLGILSGTCVYYIHCHAIYYNLLYINITIIIVFKQYTSKNES